MKYLKQGEYFIESVTDSRMTNNRRDIKVKWVGYPVATWESISILGRELRARLKTKVAADQNRLSSILLEFLQMVQGCFF